MPIHSWRGSPAPICTCMERSGCSPKARPARLSTGQNRLLVTADLAGRKTAGITPQVLPLRHTGRTDLKRLCNRTNALACVRPRQRAFADIFRTGSRHPCWPPIPACSLNQKLFPLGIPILVKNNTLLDFLDISRRGDLDPARLHSTDRLDLRPTSTEHINFTIHLRDPIGRHGCPGSVCRASLPNSLRWKMRGRLPQWTTTAWS